MAFVLDQSTWYRWPVSFDVADDGGWERQSFDGHFARLGQDRVNYLIAAASARVAQIQRGELNVDDEVIDDISIASEVLVGWEGILDAKGGEVPYSDGSKAKLLKVEAVATAIVTAWAESIHGSKKPTSKKPPAFG